MKATKEEDPKAPEMQLRYWQNGAIKVVTYDTGEELTQAVHKNHPTLKKHSPIYGVYIPDINYTSVGEIHVARDTSTGVIVHELYHAVRHYLRISEENPTGKQKPIQHLREEREAAMFGFLFNQVMEQIKGEKQ